MPCSLLLSLALSLALFIHVFLHSVLIPLLVLHLFLILHHLLLTLRRIPVGFSLSIICRYLSPLLNVFLLVFLLLLLLEYPLYRVTSTGSVRCVSLTGRGMSDSIRLGFGRAARSRIAGYWAPPNPCPPNPSNPCHTQPHLVLLQLTRVLLLHSDSPSDRRDPRLTCRSIRCSHLLHSIHRHELLDKLLLPLLYLHYRSIEFHFSRLPSNPYRPTFSVSNTQCARQRANPSTCPSLRIRSDVRCILCPFRFKILCLFL